MHKTFCAKCGQEIFEPPDLPVSERRPCGKCNSTGRSVNVAGEDFVVASALVIGDVNVEALRTLPPLLMQQVLIFADKTREGILVAAVNEPWFEIIAELERNPDLAFQISPERWEHMVAGAYKRAGFDDVILTPRSGDFGRDIVATKFGIGSVRIIDQVKRYRRGHLVAADEVRALYGTLNLNRDGASKAFLTTTSKFAPGVFNEMREIIPSRMELIDGDMLLDRLKLLAKKDR